MLRFKVSPEKQTEKTPRAPEARGKTALSAIAAIVVLAGVGYFVFFSNFLSIVYERAVAEAPVVPPWPLPLNKTAYNQKMLYLARYLPALTAVASTTASSTPLVPIHWILASTTATASTTASTTPITGPFATASTSVAIPGALWPHPAAYPEGGAILPFSRIVAYYGNFYSKQMGVLGEYSQDEVLAKLASTTAMWERADPATPTIPAIQYIAVVAQGSAGRDGMWRARMPDDQIDQALAMANQLHGLLILDVQVGKSTLQAELPELEKYLEMPNVELAIDPEFSMKFGNAPGTVIGTFDATDINYATEFLANIVREKQLPPKVLVVHRFTYDMVTNTKNIKPLPEVEVVMDMDGWGSPAKKKGTYNAVIAPFPVEFTGIKLFYHADLKAPSTRMLTPEEVLSLTPAPIYIQYQ